MAIGACGTRQRQWLDSVAVWSQRWCRGGRNTARFEPPLVGCVVSGRDFSFDALKATRQCVLNIPTVELKAAVVGCGNISGPACRQARTLHRRGRGVFMLAGESIKLPSKMR